MRTSRQFLRQVRRASLVSLLFSGGVNLLMLATPVFTLQVFETVVPSGNIDSLLLLATLAGLAVVALMLLELVRDRIMLRAALWLDHVMGQHLLHSGLRAGLGADVMALDIKSLSILRNFLTSPLVNALFDAPWVPLFLGLLVLLHPLLGIVGGLAAVVLLMAGILLSLLTSQLGEETQQAAERAERWWRAVAGRAQVAGALGLTGGATEQWEAYNRAHVAGAYSLGKRTSLIRALSRATRVTTQIAIYGVGAWLVLRGELSPGALVASSILLARALAPLEQSVMAFRAAGNALRAYRRLQIHVGDSVRTPLMDRLDAPAGHVRLSEVTVYHPTRRAPSLRDISFAIEPGACLAILGPNGAGKSTLAAVIAGAITPQVGTASLDGVPVADWQRSADHPPIGYLPDDAPLVEGTVHENITRFREASLLSVVRAAMSTGMHDTLLALPLGYETPVGPHGAGLSLRERRAVALARAAFGAPRIIVLDEPELGLDAGAVRDLQRHLAQLKASGIGLVVATQDQRLLHLADRAALLGDGRLQAFGAVADVMRHVERGRTPLAAVATR